MTRRALPELSPSPYSARRLDDVVIALNSPFGYALHLLRDRRQHRPRPRPRRPVRARHGRRVVEHRANERALVVERQRPDVPEELFPVLALKQILFYVRRIERGDRRAVVAKVLA